MGNRPGRIAHGATHRRELPSASSMCPECESKLVAVIETRSSHGRVKRRRECKDCLRRWTTYEITAEEFDNFERWLLIFGRSLDPSVGRFIKLILRTLEGKRIGDR